MKKLINEIKGIRDELIIPLLNWELAPLQGVFWFNISLLVELYRGDFILTTGNIAKLLICFLFFNIWSIILYLKRKRNEEKPNKKTE
jgi:hypothetical protein